jgi:hypothetical protein
MKKAKATKTKFEIVLTLDDFDFRITSLNDTSLEIVENKEDKQEEVFSHIRDKLQGVQQAIQYGCSVSTVSLPSGTPDIGDEPAQLHQIVDTVEALLRQAQEEEGQATQALVQVHKYPEDHRSTTEKENISLQEKWDEEKEALQKKREQLLTDKLKVWERFHSALRSVIVIEVTTKE